MFVLTEIEKQKLTAAIGEAVKVDTETMRLQRVDIVLIERAVAEILQQHGAVVAEQRGHLISSIAEELDVSPEVGLIDAVKKLKQTAIDFETDRARLLDAVDGWLTEKSIDSVDAAVDAIVAEGKALFAAHEALKKADLAPAYDSKEPASIAIAMSSALVMRDERDEARARLADIEEVSDKLVDRVLLAVCNTHDGSDLWAHSRRDPEALRSAVRHALKVKP